MLQSLITGQIAANAMKDKTGWPRQEDIDMMASAEETIYRIHNDDTRLVPENACLILASGG